MTKSDILTLEDGVWNTVTYKDAIQNVRNQDKQKSRGKKQMRLEKRTGSKKYGHGHATNSHRVCNKIRSDLWDGLYRRHEANHSGTTYRIDRDVEGAQS